MNTKYERYINYIVSDIKPPYFKNMENQYGLRPDEYEMVLSRVFNQPVTIEGRYVYNNIDNEIYHEDSGGDWTKREYDNQGNKIYWENSDGWVKREYDEQGNLTYFEDSDGYWVKYEYDEQGNKIYWEDSNGNIMDNR